jgi:AAA+ superfamily predicted ATPase
LKKKIITVKHEETIPLEDIIYDIYTRKSWSGEMVKWGEQVEKIFFYFQIFS